MKTVTRFIAVLALITNFSAIAFAQVSNPVITSFTANGQLTWSNVLLNAAYRVEWASALTGTWYQSWQNLQYIEARSNTPMTVDVPTFYRVVQYAAPPPAGMSFIDGGTLQMGDNYGEGTSDELPVHNVYVSAFYMEQTELTKSKWTSVYQWAIGHGYSFDNAGSGTATNRSGIACAVRARCCVKR